MDEFDLGGPLAVGYVTTRKPPGGLGFIRANKKCKPGQRPKANTKPGRGHGMPTKGKKKARKK